jgi:outer membrane protein OmpA-like peptidoglycan-associated protein
MRTTVIIFLLLPFLIFAQEKNPTDRAKYGIYGGWQYNSHVASFSELPGVPNCCPLFEEGDGGGYSIGLTYDLPMPWDLWAGLRVGYTTLGAELTETENDFVRIGDEVVTGQFEHLIDASFAGISFEPYISYNAIYGLYVNVGGHINFLLAKTYEQQETIAQPSDRGVFVDTGTRTRNQSSGDLQQTESIYAAIWGGANYELPLNKNNTLLLVPAADYAIGMTDFIKTKEWKASYFRMSLGIKYSPLPSEPEIEYKEKIDIDTVEIESQDIKIAEYIKGREIISKDREVSDDLIVETTTTNRVDTIYTPVDRPEIKLPGPEISINVNTTSIKIGERYISESFPLLPVVFFEANSDRPIDIYNLLGDKRNFSLDKESAMPLDFHKDLLNIIGRRMDGNSKASITLKGYADSTTEQGDCALARRRAEKVKQYLTDIWGIEPERIDIDSAVDDCAPENPTVTRSESGFAENRRVAISTGNEELLLPVRRRKPVEVAAIDPPSITVDPEISADSGVVSWRAVAMQKNDTLFNISRRTKPEPISHKITEKQAMEMVPGRKIEIYYQIKDSAGNMATDYKPISVVRDTLEYEVERIAYVLFEVRRSGIRDHHRNLIRNFVRNTDADDKIKITGYTDKLGDPEINVDLAKQRARNTADYIKEIDLDANIIYTRGLVFEEFPPGIESYNTPAERFLSRTVLIEIIKE